MKKKYLYLVLVAFVYTCFSLEAQNTKIQSSDPVVLSYQRNFIRASMSTKIDLIYDASRITTVNMSPLYIDAIEFIRRYYPMLGTDSQLIDLASAVCLKVTVWKDPSVLAPLTALFSEFSDYRVQTACIGAFSVLARGNTETIQFLNSWFASAVRQSPPVADTRTLIACAQTLGKLGDSSSFAILFTAATGKTDSGVVAAASSALNEITENYSANILAIISEKRIQDTYAAFSLAMKNSALSPGDKGSIAEAAFAVAIDYPRSVNEIDNPLIQTLVQESLFQLKTLTWTKASPLVVKLFYQMQSDYKNSRTTVDSLVPVIETMGAMATSETAQALSIFLGLLNSETEQKKTYNEQLMLAVIQALGDLGDKSAFDYLLYVGYLDYPETVKKASRDALARLQW